MSAQVASLWVEHHVSSESITATDARDSCWRVWVEHDGRYVLAGEYPGTEGEAIARALAATGADRAFSLQLAHYKMSVGQIDNNTGGITMASSDEHLLAEKLRDAVLAIEGVTLKDGPSGTYYVVKLGSTTLGYVNGKRKPRVDPPARDGGKRERVVVTESREIPKAVKLLQSFAPVES